MNRSSTNPPRLARWILSFLRYYINEHSMRSDLDGEFREIFMARGRIQAKLWYWGQILYAMYAYCKVSISFGGAMFKNYIVIAFRNLTRHKGYSFINIFGLGLGMACTILILLWVQDELSYDRYHSHAGQIYRVVQETHFNNQIGHTAFTQAPLAPALMADFPDIINTVRFHVTSALVINGEKRFQEERFFFADSSVFDVFSFPLAKGNPKTALIQPFSVVITKKMAKKYFGNNDPMGKTLNFDNKHDFKITGILAEIPLNSHFQFDFMASFESLKGVLRNDLSSWWWPPVWTYIHLSKEYSQVDFENGLSGLVEKYRGKQVASLIKLQVQPLTRIHLHSHMGGELGTNSDIAYVFIFSLIAVFILLIACFNFMNLSTARFTTRVKEVGMRKVLGAHRFQLIKQFLGESVFIGFISLILAVVLVRLFLPVFITASGKDLSIHSSNVLVFLMGLMGVGLFAGVLSGGYPALFLSAFRPVAMFKGTFTKGSGRFELRKLLVVAQFAISIALIIGTGIILSQVNFIRNKRLGFNKEQIIVMPMQSREIKSQYENIRVEFLRSAKVQGVSASSGIPGVDGAMLTPFQSEDIEEAIDINTMSTLWVDYDFIEMLGIEVVTGRNFSREFATDAKEAFILNETAVKKLVWGSPLGKKFAISFQERGKVIYQKQGYVIGVVKDFHFFPLEVEIQPLALHVDPSWSSRILARVSPDDMLGTLDFLKSKWEAIVPDYPLEFSFLDQELDSLYRAETRLSKIVGYFSLLAILIACLGLFGLASFSSTQRTKEIGIRKVLGASIPNIFVLLSKEFIKLILIANFIAWPLTYLVMKKWLQDFAYRINISIETFLIGGFLVLVIALLTVSYQSLKAATSNPVDSIRYE